ncbi:putative kinase [Serratia fonticola]|uniref:Putative kinase n=1 Tax=Serratia fonticola TaxID=47917 RepID=A0A542D1Y0_SERFO|nr:AAA family ATPase [Serratia fonticola]TQI80882.1 putative kinase [Serratia fonticola]TQI97093.1 putative kinase [Serratia fonticola]TVZ71589.1 putative kinase [Serratia fonticola]
MWCLSEDKRWAALAERFRWVADMHQVPQDPRHHAEGDVAIHTQRVLAALVGAAEFTVLPPQQRELLWAAALLHDVEKRSTTRVEADGSVTSPNHAKRGELTTRSILYRDIATPFHVREHIAALVRFHGLPLWIMGRPSPERALLSAALRLDTRLLAILARADVFGRDCEDQSRLLENIELFELFCQEQHCWGQARSFASDEQRYHYLTHPQASVDFVPYAQFNSEVILLCALPGMGKDRYIAQHAAGMETISLDNIRRQHRLSPTDKQATGWVVQQAKAQARVLLRRGEPFVWNATNITRQLRCQLVELFTAYRARVKIVYLEVPYAQWQQQNAGREHSVPLRAMEHMLSKLEIPQADEAHEVEWIVKDA